MNDYTAFLIVIPAMLTGTATWIVASMMWNRRYLSDNDSGVPDTLPSFDRTKPCPKCGARAEKLDFEYYAARRSNWFRVGHPEHMRRCCGFCRAVWYEAPNG